MAQSQVSAILVSVTLSTVLWTRAGQAQDARLEWLRHNAIVVRSIHPNDTNFVDLAPLIERIGRARIVLLGEQTHADGATFLAKTRIIRFLHERMGFGVLAWEASLFAREQMETALQRAEPWPHVSDLCLFRIWARSGHVRPVFEYSRETHATRGPLVMAGFDIQGSGSNYSERLKRGLIDFFDLADPSLLRPEHRVC
jgi:erythromycin esterase